MVAAGAATGGAVGVASTDVFFAVGAAAGGVIDATSTGGFVAMGIAAGGAVGVVSTVLAGLLVWKMVQAVRLA